ncbi:MAG: hypothetical protein ACK5ZG_06200 [Phycisphaerae bacterium]
MVQFRLSVVALMCVVSGSLVANASAQFALQTLPALPDGTPATSWTMMEDGRTFWQRQSGSALASYRFRDGAWQARDWYNFSSDDGEIYAEIVPSGGNQTVRVTRNGVAQVLSFSRTELHVHDISNDGEIIYASGRNSASFPESTWILRWNGTTYENAGTAIGLPMHTLPVGNATFFAPQTSANGRWYAGDQYSDGNNGTTASFRSVDAAPFAPFVPPAITPPFEGVLRDQNSSLKALSRTGQVVVGTYSARLVPTSPGSSLQYNGNFIWNAVTGTSWASPALNTFLNTLSADFTLPADGRYVIATQFPSGTQSVFDTQSDTALSVETLLTQSGVDLTGWSQLRLGNWSLDGLTISGTGLHEFAPGQFRGDSWFVTIPTPGTLLLLSAGSMTAARRRRLL